MFVIVLFAIVSACTAGVIPQQHSFSQEHGSHDGQGHGQATSYQHFKISNYNPVPVYLKKEHAQLLEHPEAHGHTATNLQVHHGGQHDHGYALVSGTHEQQHLGGHGGQDLGGYGGQVQGGHGGQDLGGHGGHGGQDLGGHGGQDLGGHGGHGGQDLGGYAGHEQQLVVAQHVEQQHEGAEGADLGHYNSGADLSGHGLQAYATQDVDYGHDGQQAAEYEQGAAAYEQVEADPHHHEHYQ